MRKLLTLGTFLMLIMTLFSVLAHADENNLLLNGNFEGAWVKNDAKEASYYPEGWTGSINNHDELGPSADVKVEGESALRIVSTAASKAQVLNSRGVAVESGGVYILSYWVYVKEGGIGMSVVDNTKGRFMTETNTRSYAEEFRDGEWQFIEFFFEVAEGTEEIRLSLSQSPLREVPRTEAYFDDIRIIPLQ